MLVPLRNACWIFVKLSNKLCVCKFISASTYLPNGCKDTKKYSIYHSFLMKKYDFVLFNERNEEKQLLLILPHIQNLRN